MTSRNKNICTLTALAALSNAARAQSSVTLYGVADLGVRYLHNEGAALANGLQRLQQAGDDGHGIHTSTRL